MRTVCDMTWRFTSMSPSGWLLRQRTVALLTLALTVGAYAMWWGGSAPPGRQLAAALPLLAVPLAALCVPVALRHVPESHDPQAHGRFDVLGAVLGGGERVGRGQLREVRANDVDAAVSHGFPP